MLGKVKQKQILTSSKLAPRHVLSIPIYTISLSAALILIQATCIFFSSALTRILVTCQVSNRPQALKDWTRAYKSADECPSLEMGQATVPESRGLGGGAGSPPRGGIFYSA